MQPPAPAAPRSPYPNRPLNASAIASSGHAAVPNVFTSTQTGSARPITYAISTRHRLAIPAATTFFASHLAAYVPDRSTLDRSLPENAPPPCGTRGP